MDLTATTQARSDQQNFDDYAGGIKRTVTISKVSAGSAEQPVDIQLVEFPGRPFKPSKSMRRVLVAAWGSETDAYTGRRMTLYGDPTVRFGGQVVGGIKISHLSHIDKTLKIALTVTRGKREPFTVEPLVDAPRTKVAESTADMITPEQSKTMGELLDKLALTERAATLNYVNAIIGHKVLTRNELTRAEAAKVIESLEADLVARDGVGE